LKTFKRVAELPSPGFLQGSYTKHSAAGLGNGPGCRVRLPGPWTRQPGPAIDSSIHRLIVSSIHRFTGSSSHRVIDSSIHNFIKIPLGSVRLWARSPRRRGRTRQPGPAIDASSHCPLLHWNMMTCLNEWCAEYVNRLMQNGPVDRDGRNVSENIRGSRSQS
jgi:hypothetical protein